MAETISGEDRPITALIMPDGRRFCAQPNLRIEPYSENGQMAYVIWFALKTTNGIIVRRINSSYVEQVCYDEEAKDV
jgi:hypothetical protein